MSNVFVDGSNIPLFVDVKSMMVDGASVVLFILQFQKLVTIILKSLEKDKNLPRENIAHSRQHQCCAMVMTSHGVWAGGGPDSRRWSSLGITDCNYTQQSVGTSADTCSALQRSVGLRPSSGQHLQHYCSNLEEVTQHCRQWVLSVISDHYRGKE